MERKTNFLFLTCITFLSVIGLFALLDDKEDKPNIDLDEEPNGFDTDAKNLQKDFQNISKDFDKAKKRLL